MSRANTSPAPPQPDLDQEVAAVRGFNRFYTRKLGVLNQHLLDSAFSLSEARVMYELAHRDDAAAKEIGIELGLDAGYLSRMVQNFEENGLITRKPLPTDRRQYQLSLTAKGRQAFARLDRRSHDEVGAMLGQLGEAERARLVNAMQTIEHVLGPQTGARPGFLLRSHRPGDIGWVVSRHAPSMPRNMAGTSVSRRWSPRSRHNSSGPSTPRANTAGSRRSTASRSARSSWSRLPRKSRSCACCWWRKRRAASAWGAR
jgi:DNA-binding MarR family transcriptional regulator